MAVAAVATRKYVILY